MCTLLRLVRDAQSVIDNKNIKVDCKVLSFPILAIEEI